MSITPNYIGVDIAKRWSDVYDPATRRHACINMDDKSLKAFIKKLPKGAHLVFEASGGYERPLQDMLIRHGIAYSRMNPRRVREFARASGHLAKTDKVDAKVLTKMGELFTPDPTLPPCPHRQNLSALVARREDLVADKVAETNRLQQARGSFIRNDIKSHIELLKRRILKVEAEMQRLVAKTPELAALNARLQSAPGLGPITAASLIARLPELGRVNRRAIAALAGLAPHACESGIKIGKRRTWGGREGVRRSLYQAAFIASRFDPALKAYRKRLQDAGKPFKVAIIATARKLLTQLNAIVKEARDYQKIT
jgi:transposase